MTNRVVLGKRGGVSGMWVSAPGVDVLTAADAQMLLSTSRANVQIVASGVFTGALAPSFVDVAIPNLGFKPIILFACPWYKVTWTFLSIASVRTVLWKMGYAVGPNGPGQAFQEATGSNPSNQVVRYAVTNVPCGL